MHSRIWISWEQQRRSIELAKKFKCKFFLIEKEGVLRYPISILQTLFICIRERPALMFVQNPSMILAALACYYGLVRKTFIIVDRHTTFRLNKPHSGSLRIWLFMRLHYMTIKMADLTIVTNDYLANIVKSLGGHPIILPDKLPEIKINKRRKLKGKYNLLMISSFGNDEPIYEVIDAIKYCPDYVFLYITGNFRKGDFKLPVILPPNVIFTDFIPDQDYIDLLYSVDIAIALTTSDYCMLCGCYEAISAEKVLITSNKSVLKKYFKDAIFVENTAKGISDGILYALENIQDQKKKIVKMKEYLEHDWQKLYKNIEVIIKRKNRIGL